MFGDFSRRAQTRDQPSLQLFLGERSDGTLEGLLVVLPAFERTRFRYCCSCHFLYFRFFCIRMACAISKAMPAMRNACPSALSNTFDMPHTQWIVPSGQITRCVISNGFFCWIVSWTVASSRWRPPKPVRGQSRPSRPRPVVVEGTFPTVRNRLRPIDGGEYASVHRRNTVTASNDCSKHPIPHSRYRWRPDNRSSCYSLPGERYRRSAQW